MAALDKLAALSERRRDRRRQAERQVSLLFAGAWHACVIVNVSRGGAAVSSEQRPPVDKEIIIRIADLGLFKCRVLRHLEEGFAVRFEAADFDPDWILSEPVLASPSPAVRI